VGILANAKSKWSIYFNYFCVVSSSICSMFWVIDKFSLPHAIIWTISCARIVSSWSVFCGWALC
jgi:hypothetical protein